MALWTTFAGSCERYPDKPALLFGDDAWTYRDLFERSEKLSQGLLALGIHPGDRIALHFANGPEFVCAYFAAFAVGAIAVPVNPRLTAPEAAYVLDHSGARFYLGQDDLFSPLEARPDALASVEGCYIAGDLTPHSRTHQLSELLEEIDSTRPLPAVLHDDPAIILYTSGSTARPKGVVHSHASLARSVESYGEITGLTSSDVSAVMGSLAHVIAFALQLLLAFTEGASILMFAHGDPSKLIAEFERHRVTHCVAVPLFYAMLIHAPGAAERDLSSLRVCYSGGDAVTPELQRSFHGAFGVELAEGYGLTEAPPGIGNLPHGEKRAGSIGRPIPGTEVRLVNREGREVPTGEVGEILLRTPARMIGYWNDPEATAAALDGEWLRTGDLGRCDEDGWYQFAGRQKEIIIRGGSNVSPQEVEERIAEHPAVQTVGVVGIPDSAYGEAIVGYVSLREGADATPEELRAFLSDRLAAHKIPERFVFLPDLPKGPTGKVNRRSLKERAMSAPE